MGRWATPTLSAPMCSASAIWFALARTASRERRTKRGTPVVPDVARRRSSAGWMSASGRASEARSIRTTPSLKACGAP